MIFSDKQGSPLLKIWPVPSTHRYLKIYPAVPKNYQRYSISKISSVPGTQRYPSFKLSSVPSTQRYPISEIFSVPGTQRYPRFLMGTRVPLMPTPGDRLKLVTH